jgi:hypothetical protein
MTSSFSELSNGPVFKVVGAAKGLWAASFARDAVHFLRNHLAIRQHAFADPQLRLGDKSIAPSSSARSVTRTFTGQ